MGVFADVDAYLYISSIAAYGGPDLPRREEETPLEEFTPEHVVDDPAAVEPMKEWAAYGPRKAECDRACFAAAEDGVNALVVRPTFVLGAEDSTERFDYWTDRVANDDRVIVPGDGENLLHHVYVADVARALRTVAEHGTPGEAYNVGARRLLTMDQRLRLLAEALETDVTLVHASGRELAPYDLDPAELTLVRPHSVITDTTKLTALGWESTPHPDALARTAEEHLESDRTGRHHGPAGEVERSALQGLTS